MSDDDRSSFTAEFLIRHRADVAAGNQVYPLGSPRQIEKLAELDARLDFGRRIGEIEPAPPPMSADLIGEQRLAAEYPLGVPTYDLDEHTAEFHNTQFDQIEALDDRSRDQRERETADDYEQRPNRFCAPFCGYRAELGRKATGGEVVEAMLKAAEPAVRANAEDAADVPKIMKLLRANRQLLDYYAAKGQYVAGHAAKRARYGLKP